MNKFLYTLIFVWCVVLAWSAIYPYDYFTWFLEVLPGLIYLIVLALTFKKFQFTKFTYFLILLHCIVLFVGAKYTYARVPFFNWIQDVFGQSRNNYDKLGHFMQGFVPAAITREILIRKNVVKGQSWLAFLTVCVCLAISAMYELFEWFVAEVSGQSAEDFLGMQGYAWDTQSDMLFATIGACCLLLFFSKIHNKQIEMMR